MTDSSNIKESSVYTNKIIDYQKNSIISRTIIDKKAGSVTFFAFSKGQGLSEHSAPYDALVHILDGEAEIVISGISYKLKKDQFIIMPAGEPHSLSAITKFKMMLIMLKS
ncbi:MAG: cupin [miscellaneous Crenarchaeota group-6 archaeon AD8-1]|nr:MAG: cupin [miscellaneous Crenarchaeota group-6 archaeon AD8-1]